MKKESNKNRFIEDDPESIKVIKIKKKESKSDES